MHVLHEQAAPLLENLWRDNTGWAELRMLKPEGSARRPLFMQVPLKKSNLDVAFEWAKRENDAKNNAYMSVHPRTNPRGRNEDVANYCAMIADLDDTEKSWPAVLKLQAAGAPASACVRTARGVHLYWFLRAPETVTGETRDTMVRLQAALDSDRVHDPARILRLPGTLCWKNNQPHQVYLAWLNAAVRYSTAEVAEAVRGGFPDLVVNEPETCPPPLQAVCAAPGQFTAALWSRYAAPWPRGTRSEQCLSFIQTAVLYGWDDAAIRAALADLPIGQHYADRGFAAESSLNHDIYRARQHVAARRGRLQTLTIDRASAVLQAEGYKLRVWFRTPGDSGAPSVTFCEWLTVPHDSTPPRMRVRWQAFTDAVGPAATPDELTGRTVLAELKEDGGRVRAVWFGSVV